MKAESATAMSAAPAIDRAAKETINLKVSLHGGDLTPNERARFEAWRRADPSNEDAWARLRSA